jgi:hypothetical protein
VEHNTVYNGIRKSVALPKHTMLGKEKQSSLFILKVKKEEKSFIRLTTGVKLIKPFFFNDSGTKV